MNEIVDTRNVANVCRLCLSTKEPRSSVFADQAYATVSLATKIQTFLSIEILASDGAPTLICSDCLRRINEWYSYREHCQRSQQKLKQFLVEGADSSIVAECKSVIFQQVEYIKVEPKDRSESTSEPDAVLLSSGDEDTAEKCDEFEEPRNAGAAGNDATIRSVAIKREPIDEMETNETAFEMESVRSAELLLNPMAVAGHRDNRQTEVDTKRESSIGRPSRKGMKRKVRRGPPTHYRGLRRYKQRCSYCQIYLHSKWSYSKHMERFHSGGGKVRESKKMSGINGMMEIDEAAMEMDAETIEDVEDELMSLEKDAPLTPVQQSIISQLKTFSCYACRVCFTDRRSTLNHIRQHMPDLRPYTCIACLTEFADRSVYKLHCGASFQCAMKIALVVPEHGTEKYFTCNMCLRSMADRRELLSHLSKHSDKQYERLIGGPSGSPPRLEPAPPSFASPTSSRETETRRPVDDSDKKKKLTIKRLERSLPAPYKNGDPAHNHLCVYCGMIYKYKQNLYKHVSLCKKLPPESRLCYRCVNCGLTFLAFNKFHTHVSQAHGRKNDLVCHRCEAIIAPSDFLLHIRDHCDGKIADLVSRKIGASKRPQVSQATAEIHGNNGYDRSSSSSRVFADGRKNRHPRFSTAETINASSKKTTAFTCKICRCSFSEASIFQAHMVDHENGDCPAIDPRRGNRISIKSDPGGSTNVECFKCGKIFANHQNLRRHERNVHDEPVGRFNCFTCARTFVHEYQWTEHVEKEHRRVAERVASCPQCPGVFESQQELILHRRNVHGTNGEDNLACYICGKSFASEASLKIHRGHHFRVNSRLSVGNGRGKMEAAADPPDVGSLLVTSLDSKDWKRQSLGSPRARKSFPNRGSDARGNRDSHLQCQVCDDNFNDVSELRKHLWDVHCARAKPEKPFLSEKLRCALCAIELPDEESLESHIRWHKSDSISSVEQKRESGVQCDLCGKYYSSPGNLRKHQKRHRVAGAYVNRVRAIMPKNKFPTKNEAEGYPCTVCRKVFAKRSSMKCHRSMAHPLNSRRRRRRNQSRSDLGNDRRDLDDFPSIVGDTASDLRDISGRTEPDARIPRQQRRPANATPAGASLTRTDARASIPADVPGVPCTLCSKSFRTLTNMRQHFTKVHANRQRTAVRHQCTVNGCGLTFDSVIAQRNHEKSHVNVVYSCALCPQRMLSPTAMAEHVLAAHRTNRVSGNDRMTLCTKIDLNDYIVEGANGRQCPACGITYPNNKALKVHYLKIHENAA